MSCGGGTREHANAMAARLAEGVRACPGWRYARPSIPTRCSRPWIAGHIGSLQRDWDFYVWGPAEHVARWMTAFDTTEADVDAFVAAVRAVLTPA